MWNGNYKSKTSKTALQQVMIPPDFSSRYKNEGHPEEILGNNRLESPKYPRNVNTFESGQLLVSWHCYLILRLNKYGQILVSRNLKQYYSCSLYSLATQAPGNNNDELDCSFHLLLHWKCCLSAMFSHELYLWHWRI